MKKSAIISTILFSAVALSAVAKTLWIEQKDNITLGTPLTNTGNIKLSDNGASVDFTMVNGEKHSVSYTNINKVTIGDDLSVVTIDFNGNDAKIVNPYAFKG